MYINIHTYVYVYIQVAKQQGKAWKLDSRGSPSDVCLYIHMYIYMYTYICICIYIYIFRACPEPHLFKQLLKQVFKQQGKSWKLDARFT